MATWHQDKASPRNSMRFFHDTLWVALTDPPGEMRSSVLFNTEKEAREFAAMVPHTIVLPPAKTRGAK